MALGCFATYVFDVVSPFGYRNRIKHNTHMKRAFNKTAVTFNGFLIMLRKTPLPMPASAAARMMFLAMFLLSYILLRSYVAKLTSFLTDQTLVARVTSWSDLQSNSQYKFGVLANTTDELYFTNSSDASLRSMTSRMYPFVHANDMLPALRDGTIDAIVGERPQLIYSQASPPCDLMLLDPPFTVEYVSFILNDTGLGLPAGVLKQAFNDGIQAAIDDQTIETLYQSYFTFPSSCAAATIPTFASEPPVIGPEHFKGMGIALIGMIVLAVAILQCERCVFHRRHGTHGRHDPSAALWRSLNKGMGYIYPATPTDKRKHRFTVLEEHRSLRLITNPMQQAQSTEAQQATVASSSEATAAATVMSSGEVIETQFERQQTEHS